jgi:hypothetical protein
MTVQLVTEEYADEIQGTLNCYDRVILRGNLQPLCYAKGMTGYLFKHKIRVFSYGTEFALPLRDMVRSNAQEIGEAEEVSIEFISKVGAFRKEERIAEIVKERGDHCGLVHIFSAMEQCPTYKPDREQESGHYSVKYVQGKCLHYYFYFIDRDLGLCYLRVPTWSPFGLQFYFNGHNALATALNRTGIEYKQADNAFLSIAHREQANQLAMLDVENLQAKLNAYAARYCPAASHLGLSYQWSIMQAEYATDIIFRNQTNLKAFFPPLLEYLIQAVKPADIATFLGRKLHGNYQDEMGNRFNHRLEGRRIKHRMGPVSIKMYDKFCLILRIETTVNDVSFFRHFRQVQHRDGSTSLKDAPMRKSIYSLMALAQPAQAFNHRYLKFISAIDTPEAGASKLRQLTETIRDNHHCHKGFNLLSEQDSSLFRLLLSGEFVIHGFSNRDLRTRMADKKSGQITRLLKRLRVHGLIKRTRKRYRYYLTDLGRQAALLALHLRESVIIPHLAFA